MNEAVHQTDAEQSEHITQYAVVLFEHIEAQINRADTKSQLILTADALLAAALTIAPGQFWTKVVAGRAGVLAFGGLIAALILFVALVLSVYYSVLVALPTLSLGKKKQPDGLNLFYFADIARINRLEFIRGFSRQTDADISEALLEQVHVKSVIAATKFKNMRLSSVFLLVAIVTGGGLQLVNWLLV